MTYASAGSHAKGDRRPRMYLVTVDHGVVHWRFLHEDPAPRCRPFLAAAGVAFEEPEPGAWDDWARPAPVLGRSRFDPRRYRLFPSAARAARERYEPLPGVASVHRTWKEFERAVRWGPASWRPATPPAPPAQVVVDPVPPIAPRPRPPAGRPRLTLRVGGVKPTPEEAPGPAGGPAGPAEVHVRWTPAGVCHAPWRMPGDPAVGTLVGRWVDAATFETAAGVRLRFPPPDPVGVRRGPAQWL